MQADPTAMPLFDVVQRFGVLGILAIIILTGWKRLWVWGHQYDELAKDRDFWRDRALDKDT